MYHQEQLQQEQQLNKMNGEPEMPETEPVSIIFKAGLVQVQPSLKSFCLCCCLIYLNEIASTEQSLAVTFCLP